MKLIVFGATGKTGKEIVKQSLAQGHEVTAFVPDPSKMTLERGDLKIMFVSRVKIDNLPVCSFQLYPITPISA